MLDRECVSIVADVCESRNSYARPPKPRTLRMPISHAGFGLPRWRCQRSVRRLLNVGWRIVLGCWFTTEGACSLLISLWFRAHAYTNDRSFGEGLAGPRGSVARNRVFADPNMRPFSGIGNRDRCCETLVIRVFGEKVPEAFRGQKCVFGVQEVQIVSENK